MAEPESTPGWTRGYEISTLKAFSQVFRVEFEPYTHGAFGIPKERDIADALAAGRLIWTRDGAATGVCVRLSAPSVHADYAGRRARLLPGDVLVRALAGTPDGRQRIIENLGRPSREAIRPAPALWVEGHVENAGLVAQLGQLGFERVLTKVSASSDLKGLWLRLGRGVAAGARLPGSLAPCDALGLATLAEDWLSTLELDCMRTEAGAVADRLAQHYSSYNKRGTWTAVALRGYDAADPGFIVKPAEMSRGWQAANPERLVAPCVDTELAALMPATMGAVERVPGRKQRVRLMRLAADGGELTRHADITDREAGTADGAIARLHVPLVSPPQCVFRSWGDDGRESRAHLAVGALAYLDVRKPHAVINPGGSERVHLVIDTHCGPELRAMLTLAGLEGAKLARENARARA